MTNNLPNIDSNSNFFNIQLHIYNYEKCKNSKNTIIILIPSYCFHNIYARVDV